MQYAFTFVALVAATYTNALVATPAHLSNPGHLPKPTAASTLTKCDDANADDLKQLIDQAIEKYHIDEYLTPQEIELAQSYIFGGATPTSSGTPTVSLSARAATETPSLDELVDAAVSGYTDEEKTLLGRDAAPEPTAAPEPVPPRVNNVKSIWGKATKWAKGFGEDIGSFFKPVHITKKAGYSLFLPPPPGKRDAMPMTAAAATSTPEPTPEPIVEVENSDVEDEEGYEAFEDEENENEE